MSSKIPLCPQLLKEKSIYSLRICNSEQIQGSWREALETFPNIPVAWGCIRCFPLAILLYIWNSDGVLQNSLWLWGGLKNHVEMPDNIYLTFLFDLWGLSGNWLKEILISVSFIICCHHQICSCECFSHLSAWFSLCFCWPADEMHTLSQF